MAKAKAATKRSKKRVSRAVRERRYADRMEKVLTRMYNELEDIESSIMDDDSPTEDQDGCMADDWATVRNLVEAAGLVLEEAIKVLPSSDSDG